MDLTIEELAEQLSKVENIKFNQDDYRNIKNGEMTMLKENVLMPDGSVKDTKIRVELDHEGQIMLKYHFLQDELIIPKKIGNKTLSDFEIKALYDGKIIQVDSGKGGNYYLQIDTQLNSIVVKTPNEIKLDNVSNFSVGGYEFSDKEVGQLKNLEEVKTVICKTSEGYFTANVSLTEDKKGFIWDEYKAIPKNVAEKLLKEKVEQRKHEALVVVDKQNLFQDGLSALGKDPVFDDSLNTNYAEIDILSKDNTLKKSGFVKIDYNKELKSIDINTSEKIDLTATDSFSFGGYNFSKEEIKKLNKGEVLKDLTFKSGNGYFTADLKLKEDGKGFVCSNCKSYSNEQAPTLFKDMGVNIEKLNTLTYTKDYSPTVNGFITPNASKEFEQELIGAIKNNDFKKVKSLADFKPTNNEKLIESIKVNKEISEEQKQMSFVALGIDSSDLKKAANVIHDKGKQSKSIKIEQEKMNGKDPFKKEKNVNKAGNIAKEMLGDM